MADFNLVFDFIRMEGARLDPGLLDSEVCEVEATYGFRFPPDLRALLQTAVPVSDSFPDWRGPQAPIRERLEWPVEGICFDIENNNHWRRAWGSRPDSLTEALWFAQAEIAKAPVLIPIFSHRYIPEEPHLDGNPVFSVWQTDIIYYGYDLASYFQHEFQIPLPPPKISRPRPIRFWDYYISEQYSESEQGYKRETPVDEQLKWLSYGEDMYFRGSTPSADDPMAYFQMTSAPSLWFWALTKAGQAQMDNRVAEDTTGRLREFPRSWRVWLAGSVWRSSAHDHRYFHQPVDHANETEVAGQVLWTGDGEFWLISDRITLLVQISGPCPQPKQWITVVGKLHADPMSD